MLSLLNSGGTSMGALTALAFGRAVFIALLAIVISGSLGRWLAARRGREAVLAWTLLGAPFFTPPLLVSYAFAKFAAFLIVSTWGHEALYVGVLALKFIPVAVVLRVLIPSPLSPESRYAFRLLASPGWWPRWRFALRAAGHSPWIAGGVVFLLAFADFELASLWSVKTWTMAIFDAQVGGYALGATLRLAAWPLLVQFGVLGWIAWKKRDLPGVPAEDAAGRSRFAWVNLVSAATIVSVVPLCLVVGQAIPGIPSLLQNFVLGSELGASVVFALVAASAATFLAVGSRRSLPMSLGLVTPGLFGALILALLVLALFQAPLLRALYDTPLPLGIALMLLLLPLAVLLAALWLRPNSALHVARQAGSRRLIWELETRPRAVAAGILFCCAYFDFTASSILAPTGFTPVFVRLHNLAHYGQTAVLSAMMLAAFATPILVLLLTGTAWRLYARGHGR